MIADVNGLLLAVLRPALTGALGLGINEAAQVGTRIPADLDQVLPFVYARATPGGRTKGVGSAPGVPTGSPLTRFQVPFQIDVYATSGPGCHVVSTACLQALHAAVSRQLVTEHGHLASVETFGPAEFPSESDIDAVVRHLITGTLTARPPA